MATHILKMLSDGSRDLSDEAYDSLEDETRMALVALLVRQECELVVSRYVVESNDAAKDRRLYLGSHECGTRKVDDLDDVYIELWAWIDEDGSDFVTWNIAQVDEYSTYPIRFCPFCGYELAQFLTDDVTAESTDD